MLQNCLKWFEKPKIRGHLSFFTKEKWILDMEIAKVENLYIQFST